MLIIDISANNAEPNWPQLKVGGVGGVWLKATEGLTFKDKKFKAWRAKANAAGLRVGAYHYARPDLHPTNPAQEAVNFTSTVKKLDRRDLRPVLDFETKASLSGTEMTAWARSFNITVKAFLDCGPLFYTYPSFISSYMKIDKPVGYGLWLASYGRNDGKEHSYSVPAPWKKAVAHQYTSKGHVFGEPGRVDLDSFGYDLKQFTKTQGWPPALLAHPWLGLR